jgi:hypothetical protein
MAPASPEGPAEAPLDSPTTSRRSHPDLAAALVVRHNSIAYLSTSISERRVAYTRCRMVAPAHDDVLSGVVFGRPAVRLSGPLTCVVMQGIGSGRLVLIEAENWSGCATT